MREPRLRLSSALDLETTQRHDPFGRLIGITERGRPPSTYETALERDATFQALTTIASRTADGRLFQNQQLSYDAVGNVIGAFDDVAEPRASEKGKPVEVSYTYDDLSRLVAASGEWGSSAPHEERYTVERSPDTPTRTMPAPEGPR